MFKVRNRSKRSKTGKITTVAAAAIAVLAFVPNANASVSLHIVPDPLNSNIGGAIIREESTTASFAGQNGWHPVKDTYGDAICNSQGAWDNSGNLVIHQFDVRNGHGFFPPYLPKGAQVIVSWSQRPIDPYMNTYGPSIMHAKVACKMIKRKISYVRKNGVRVRVVTQLHATGIGQF